MVEIITSFLRSLERPLILVLLSRRPRHGYELIHEFKKLTGRKLKPGFVYPFLHWLEKEGYTISQYVQKGKRKVKYYKLTEKGEKLLQRIRKSFRVSIKEFVEYLIKKT